MFPLFSMTVKSGGFFEKSGLSHGIENVYGLRTSSFKPGSHMPATYLRFSRRLRLTMFGDLFSGSPAHLRWIASVLKLARNANRIGAIFNSFISNMDRIVLLECKFSLALVLVMRYVRRKKKLEKMRTRRKYWVRQMLQGRTNHGQYHTLFAELRQFLFTLWSLYSWQDLSYTAPYFLISSINMRLLGTSSRATLSSAVLKVRNCGKN